MNLKAGACAIAIAVFCGGLAFGQDNPPPGNPPDNPPAQPPLRTSKNPLLLALVVQPLLEEVGGTLTASLGALFSRLIGRLTGSAPAATANPAPGAAKDSPAAAVSAPPSDAGGKDSGAAADKPAVAPSIIFSLDLLDPQTFALQHQVDFTQGAPTLRTGDVFAIEYATNVTGQVRIEDIDSAGKKFSLGTYTVQAGRDNRIPAARGIKLIGLTGTETFRMYFYPCRTSGAAADASAESTTVASLPACPIGMNTRLAQASKGLRASKSAINLETPDPTITAAAVPNYQSDDVTVSEFRIDHVAASTTQNAAQ